METVVYIDAESVEILRNDGHVIKFMFWKLTVNILPQLKQLEGMTITCYKVHVLEAYGAQPANPR